MKWFNSLSLGLVLSLTLNACGGGGDGGTGGPPPTTPQTTVSGTVQAPNGQIAFNHSPGLIERLTNLLLPTAYATIAGLSPVPDGTPVQLARANATGTGFTVLATTTTTAGTYSFNLTNLGLQVSNDLIVQVAKGAVQMRAFVTGSNVDLDPVAETSVRLVLEQLAAIPGATLSLFTVQELADIAGSINVLVSAKQVGAGTNVENTVTSIRSAVTANAGLMAFIAATAGPGQTTQGPGDVGNHISLTQGNQWQTQGTESKTGRPTVSFTNSVTITGTNLLAGVTTTVFSETNPDNTGTAQEVYRVKDTTGITNRGNNDVTDVLTPQLVPYPELRFPLQPGSTFQSFNKQGLNFGQDLDGDGKNETAAFNAQVNVVGFENVTVTAGTFPNTIRVETTLNLVVTLSMSGNTIPLTQTQTTWFASGVGPVKETNVTQSQGVTDAISEELVSYSVDGQGTNVKVLNLRTNDILYDPFRQVIYASVPSSSASNPNTIAIIDPVSGTVKSSVSTGTDTNPGKLALSDDGQFLYVGLDNPGSVARFTAATMTLGPTFSLGTFIGAPLVAGDMQVQPGNPQVVAITRTIPGLSVPSQDVAIYDNGVQRPNTIGGPVDILQFSQSASTLYGVDATTTPSNFLRMSVGPLGVSLIDAFNDLIPIPSITITKNMVFDAGLIYTSSGLIVNPAPTPPTAAQNFVVPPPDQPRTLLVVRPDSSVGRVFFIATQNFPNPHWRLYSFDQATQQVIGWFDLDAALGTPTKLIRWGTKGVAVNINTTGNQVMIIQSPLVSNQ
jgi:hypothetical protein